MKVFPFFEFFVQSIAGTSCAALIAMAEERPASLVDVASVFHFFHQLFCSRESSAVRKIGDETAHDGESECLGVPARAVGALIFRIFHEKITQKLTLNVESSSLINSPIFADEKIVSNIPPAVSVHVVVLHFLDLLDTVKDIVAAVPVRMMANDSCSFVVEVVVDSEWKTGLPVSARDEVLRPNLAFYISLCFGLGDIEELGP